MHRVQTISTQKFWKTNLLVAEVENQAAYHQNLHRNLQSLGYQRSGYSLRVLRLPLLRTVDIDTEETVYRPRQSSHRRIPLLVLLHLQMAPMSLVDYGRG